MNPEQSSDKVLENVPPIEVVPEVTQPSELESATAEYTKLLKLLLMLGYVAKPRIEGSKLVLIVHEKRTKKTARGVRANHKFAFRIESQNGGNQVDKIRSLIAGTKPKLAELLEISLEQVDEALNEQDEQLETNRESNS